MNPIFVVKNVDKLREKVGTLKSAGQRIGLVPTMGALHEGHLSLARQSKAVNDFTIVTIFVNPSQFSPEEDLDKYPKTMAEDIQQLNDIGVDCVFIPAIDEVYPSGFSTTINPPDVSKVLEGEFRPTHFAGVCTVVLKLFNMVEPDIAFFGQKDFQQVAVIKKMVADLNLNIEIVVCPTVRDPDGLAMSSRNRYLDPQQRRIALSLNETIQFAIREINNGAVDGHELMAEMRQRLIDSGATSVDYAVVADPHDLDVLDEIRKPAVVLLAAHVGDTRLIDNGLVE